MAFSTSTESDIRNLAAFTYSFGKEGSRARILDIILASFEGVYSLDFSRHFSCVFKALLKCLIYAAFWAR